MRLLIPSLLTGLLVVAGCRTSEGNGSSMKNDWTGTDPSEDFQPSKECKRAAVAGALDKALDKMQLTSVGAFPRFAVSIKYVPSNEEFNVVTYRIPDKGSVIPWGDEWNVLLKGCKVQSVTRTGDGS
ncbi:MAG: hypothetical protein AB7T49_19440 [Oligoflexales bacterium]